MPALSFTVRSIEALKISDSKQIDYWDSELPGFGLRVSSSGRKTWIAYYRFNGRKRRLSLGTYPSLSLSDARSMAKACFHEVAIGADPAKNKKDGRNAETFGHLSDQYLELHAKPNKRSWKEDERILKKEILPNWKLLKAKEIVRRDVIKLIDVTVKRGAPVHANRVLALIRKIFNFGIQRDIVVMNPCHAIPRPTKEHARERVLSPNEVGSLWLAFDQQAHDVGSIFKLYALTGQRGSEVRSMAWKDLDLKTDWWTIPGAKTKNGLSHRVPLSPQAKAIINLLMDNREKSPWVFPSPVNNLKHINNIQKAFQRVKAETGIEFVGHDLRRSAASHMAGMKIPRLVISKILNHVEPGATGVYDRHSYDAEKREALETWSQFVDNIVQESKRKKLENLSRPTEQLQIAEAPALVG